MTTATRRRTHRFIAEPTPATLRSEQERLSNWLADHPDAWNRPAVEQALNDVQTQLDAITTTGTAQTPSQ